MSLDGVKDKILCPWIVENIGAGFSLESLQAFYQCLPSILSTKMHPHGGRLVDNKGIIFVPSVQDAEQLEGILRSKNFKAAATHYLKKDNSVIIQEYTKPFGVSQVNFLIAVDKLKIGFDAKVDFVIIAKKSLTDEDWFQIKGRGLGNDVPTVYTHSPERAQRQKIAYIGVFDEVELPPEFTLRAEIPLHRDFLTEKLKYRFSSNKRTASVLEADAPSPASPAVRFAFSNVDQRNPLPINGQEAVVIPVPYGAHAFERAVGLGEIWHRQGEELKVKEQFNTIRAITARKPELREEIRRSSQNDDGNFLKVLRKASNSLLTLAENSSTQDVLSRFLVEIYAFDPKLGQYICRKQNGNSKSLQIIRLLERVRSVQGRKLEHYDLLLPQKHFSVRTAQS